MFRDIRRNRQCLTKEECIDILEHGSDGILSVLGDDDYPYGIPLNYFYYNGKIYFHCAKTGHKTDAINKHDKVSFCVVDKRKILPEMYATEYTSVIIFGRAKIMTDPEAMHRLVQLLALKYCPGDHEGVLAETNRDFPSLSMIEVTPEHMTGKKSKNLI